MDQPKAYGNVARRNIVWSGLREAANALLVVPTSMVLARLLSPSEFGTAAIAYFFLALGARLSQVGMNAALVRMKDLRPEHISTALVVNLVLGTAAWAVLTVLAPVLGASVRNEHVTDLIPVAAVTFLITSFGTVPGALLSRDLHRYRARVTSEWVATLTNSVVAILSAWQGLGFWSIVYGHLASDLARTVARLHYASWRPSFRFSTSAFRDLFSFGAGIYARNLLEYTANNIDNLIIGRLLGMASLGYYDRAYGLTTRMVARINLAGPSTSFRIFALIHEDHGRFRAAFRRVVLAVSVVGYPMLTGLMVLAPEIIYVLFGSRWMPSVLPFQILCGAGMLRLLNTYTSTATQAKGLIWSEVRLQIVSTVILAVAVALCSRWGVAGAASGVLVATMIATVRMQQLIVRLTGLRWSDLAGPQVPAVVCSIGLVCVLITARFLLSSYGRHPQPWSVLLVAVSLGLGYYAAFMLFSGFREVREMVSQTLDDLSPQAARRFRAFSNRMGHPVVTGR